MIDTYNYITAIIPFRIDCPERERNLRLVLEYLTNHHLHICLLEADSKQLFRPNISDSQIEYYFIQDKSPFFHKTRYLNFLAQLCSTPIIAIWDTDVLLSFEQIENATKSLLQGDCDLCIPYNGTVKHLNSSLTESYQKSKICDFLKMRIHLFYEEIKRPSCGGVVLVNRNIFRLAGGLNENFHGWGPEDAEFIRRFEILGYKVRWESSGPLFHFWHPKNNPENYIDQMAINQIEFIKVCCMNSEELKKYVQSWDLI